MKKRGPALDPASVMAALSALAVEGLARRDRGRRGKRSLAEIEHWKKVWHGNRRRRARAASDARAAQLRAERKAARRRPDGRTFGESIADRMLAAMAPGEWYGAHDLARAVNGPRDWHGKVLQVLRPRGYVERAPNPAWRPGLPSRRYAAGEPVAPRWLYRLTDLGQARRAAVLMVQ